MDKPQPETVHVVGVSIPFLDLVTFLVKLAFAAIPAAIIIAVVGVIIAGVLKGISVGT